MAVQSYYVRKGMSCATAQDGEEALLCLGRSRIDAAIIDLHMPGLDGFGLLTAMSDRFPLVPAVVLTASSEVVTMMECLKLGALAFVTKPLITFEELDKSVELVRTVVEGWRTSMKQLSRHENDGETLR
jgi:DNA-binding response OmpR family regulator